MDTHHLTMAIFGRSQSARQILAGDYLFQTGDPADGMYAVVGGELEVEIGGQVVEKADAGTLLGELALIEDEPRSASVRAVTDVTVVPVSKRDFLFLLHEHPTFALLVLKSVADRLRRNEPSRADA